MTTASISSSILTDIENGVIASGKVNWTAFANALKSSDYAKVGFLTVEDALTIASPFLPYAGIANVFVKLAFAIYGDVETALSGKPISFEDVLKSVLVAEGVDWNAMAVAIATNNTTEIGLLAIEDVVKILAPFLPTLISPFALPILNLLVFLGQFALTPGTQHLRWGGSEDPYDPDCLFGGGAGS